MRRTVVKPGGKRRTVPVTAGSDMGVDTSQLRSLVKTLKSARDIMDNMDDDTFQVVKDHAGNNFYDDVLDAVRMISTAI